MSVATSSLSPIGGLLLLLGTLALSGCDRQAEEAKTTMGQAIEPNIVFVAIDTLRRDHLGIYGYERNTTPFIDSLAEDGLVFEDAVAQAPWTRPSVASYLTSRYPSLLGMFDRKSSPGKKVRASVLSEDVITLPEVLQSSGYRTAAVVTNIQVDKLGAEQGFEYFKYEHKADANVVVDYATDFLESVEDATADEENGYPFFLYLHFMDVHRPTDPPPPYDTRFPTIDSAPHEDKHKAWDFQDGERLDTEEFRRFKSHKIALYDGELAFVDAEIERLAEYLKDKRLYDNTVFVIASDHGEEFWDHALFEKEHMYELLQMRKGKNIGVGHAHTMFWELLDVPLIFYGEGVPQGRVSYQVRNIDIMPTLLSLVGVDDPGTAMDGVDVIRQFKEGELASLPAYSENAPAGVPVKTLEEGDHKLIRYSHEDRTQFFLFDKKNDTLETVDVSATLPEVLTQMDERIDQFLNMESSNIKLESDELTLDEEAIRKLKALGYVE